MSKKQGKAENKSIFGDRSLPSTTEKLVELLKTVVQQDKLNREDKIAAQAKYDHYAKCKVQSKMDSYSKHLSVFAGRENNINRMRTEIVEKLVEVYDAAGHKPEASSVGYIQTYVSSDEEGATKDMEPGSFQRRLSRKSSFYTS